MGSTTPTASRVRARSRWFCCSTSAGTSTTGIRPWSTLLSAGRRVVTFDNVGVGGSTGTTPSTVTQMAHDAIAFLTAMEFGRVDMLGFSIGSFVAQESALIRPGILNRLILASSAPQGAAGKHGWTPDVIGAVGGPETSPAADVPAHPSPGAAALDPGDRDALTGLWNRRRFETELDRARENAEHVALLSMDVDRYREVIQRHGAAAAEGLIQAIAHVLAQSLRPNDTLARMGGDEFAAVFRHATPPLIQSLADGLCTAVREQSHATGTNRIPGTISIGAAFFDAGTQTHHEALLAADTALHEAKVAGGDCAIVHEPPQDA